MLPGQIRATTSLGNDNVGQFTMTNAKESRSQGGELDKPDVPTTKDMLTEPTYAHAAAIEQETFGVLDLVKFLFGSRAAIEKLARCPGTLLFGAVLVATAAVCREYDAVSLWHYPEDLLAPFAASTLLASVLFVWCKCLPRVNQTSQEPLKDYCVFLAAYWFTAPLAWLYAIPVETFLNEYQAVVCNLTFLSIVSLWRVTLFSRFISVRYRTPYIAALAWITIPCAAVAFVGLIQKQISLVGIMGGVRLTAAEQVVHDYSGNVLEIASWAFWSSIVISIGYFILRSVRGATEQAQPHTAQPGAGVGWDLWCVSALVFAVLIIGVTSFQPRMYRAAEVDRLIRKSNFSAAIELMTSAGSRDAFPPIWNPEPKVRGGYGESMAGLTRTIHAERPAIWISDLLLDRADEMLLSRYVRFGYDELDETRLREIASRLTTAERRELLDQFILLSEIPTQDSIRDFQELDIVGILGEFVSESALEADDEADSPPDDWPEDENAVSDALLDD